MIQIGDKFETPIDNLIILNEMDEISHFINRNSQILNES